MQSMVLLAAPACAIKVANKNKNKRLFKHTATNFEDVTNSPGFQQEKHGRSQNKLFSKPTVAKRIAARKRQVHVEHGSKVLEPKDQKKLNSIFKFLGGGSFEFGGEGSQGMVYKNENGAKLPRHIREALDYKEGEDTAYVIKMTNLGTTLINEAARIEREQQEKRDINVGKKKKVGIFGTAGKENQLKQEVKASMENEYAMSKYVEREYKKYGKVDKSGGMQVVAQVKGVTFKGLPLYVSKDLGEELQSFQPELNRKNKKDKLPWIVPVAMQLVDIVQTNQQINFYHGDLKLGNILMNPKTKKVSIIDYGESKEVDPSSKKLPFDILDLGESLFRLWTGTKDLNKDKFQFLNETIEGHCGVSKFEKALQILMRDYQEKNVLQEAMVALQSI
jgi:hypothetical protein